jgi:hypothetical protein
MKPSSAKAKGRKLVADFVKELSASLEISEEEFTITSSGVNGEDMVPSPFARKRFPYSLEAKSRSAIVIYTWFEQAKKHGHEPLLLVKQNRSEPLIIMRTETFMKLLKNEKDNNGDH